MKDRSCLEVFETQASHLRATEALRVEGSSSGLSYSALNELSARLAGEMVVADSLVRSRQDPAASTPLVCILMRRHAGLIASMLATLKAGAAYVPVDPAFPPDRQAYIFEHSKCCLLLADVESYQEAKGLGVDLPPVIVLDGHTGVVVQRLPGGRSYSAEDRAAMLLDARRRQAARDRGGLMYVLYTSGSTGKPKGVMLSQFGVTNLVSWFAGELRVGAGTRVLGLTTACFDISVLEIFLPLISGGTLVLAQSASQKDPFRLLDLIREQGVSVVQATPTTFEMLLAAGWAGDAGVDLLVGGEAFRSSLLPLAGRCRSLRNVCTFKRPITSHRTHRGS